MHVQCQPRNNRLRETFHNGFCLTHDSFLELAIDMMNNELFVCWMNKNCAGADPSNLKLLLLGVLRCFGRVRTFDGTEEATAISREVNGKFFHSFLTYGKPVLCRRHVIDVAHLIDGSKNEKLFAAAGVNCFMGSIDATHVGMIFCSNWATHNYLGPKLIVPSRTCNATIAHWLQMMGSTCGHPATWNDETMNLHDDLVRGVKDGVVFEDNEFTLLEHDANENTIDAMHKGARFMVDNGCLSWSCAVAPIEDDGSCEHIKFSEWLESMRKVVERTFGITKGRFFILRNGFRFHSIEKCDEAWLTCCVLNNRLLFVDRLHENWDIGKLSTYEKECNKRNQRAMSFAL